MSQWKTIPTINDTTPTKEKTKAYNKRVKVMIDKAPVYEGSEEDIKKKIKEHQEELFLKQKADAGFQNLYGGRWNASGCRSLCGRQEFYRNR